MMVNSGMAHGKSGIDFRDVFCSPNVTVIPKVGITSFSGESSIIVDEKHVKSLIEHLEEAGLIVREAVPCDRRILGFKWERNEMVPVIDPSLEETSEVWLKLEDPSHKAGRIIGDWFDRQFKAGSFSAN